MADHNYSSVPDGFKEIPGYDGRYFINEQGQVWSCFRNRILTQHLDSQKRYFQSLMMVPGRKTGIPRYIHKLVAITWLGNPPGEIGSKRGQYCVNHKDGNKLNNHTDNLEWTTCEGNLRHAWENGLQNFGENRPNALFTSEDVRSIRSRLLAGEKCKAIAVEFGVGVECIKKIQQYSSWKRQDWDLIEPMMEICKSKWLRITLDCVRNGGKFWDYSRPYIADFEN